MSCGCGIKASFGRHNYNCRRKRKSYISDHNYDYMKSSYRKNKRFGSRFGAFTGGSPSSLLNMEGPFAFGRRRRRSNKSRKRFGSRFGAFTGGSPSSLLNMEGPFAFGRRRRLSKRLSKRFKKKKAQKKAHKRYRCFGSSDLEGYKGLTSFPNVYANYFGSAEPFISASNWWYPVTNGQLQSPQMLQANP